MKLSSLGLLSLLLLITSAAPVAAASKTFPLMINTPFAACVGVPNAKSTPTAVVKVVQGKLNDTLIVTLKHVRPNLGFDLFTVQNSPFDAAGNPVVIPNFGLAWYQSDVEVSKGGSASVKIQTILVNQIFGFDAASGLAPTNTFHVGLWFDDPQAAAACGFTGFTPFNGVHHARYFVHLRTSNY